MPLSNFNFITDATVGAPTLSGTNGDGNAWLNYLIVTVLGGTRPFHDATTNQSVFRFPGGTQTYLYARHDSAASGNAGRMIIRLAEGATGFNYADLIDPVPLNTQVADTSCNMLVSNAASATTREYRVVAWDGGLVGAVKADGSWWIQFAFGDPLPIESSDLYSPFILIRNAATQGLNASAFNSGISGTWAGTLNVFFLRSVDGTVKSTRGSVFQGGTGAIGGLTTAPTLSSAVNGDILHEAIWLTCGGSQSGTDVSKGRFKRAAIPNMRTANCGGIGSYTDASTITDGNYALGCVLRPLWSQSGTNQAGFLLQETNDWYP